MTSRTVRDSHVRGHVLAREVGEFLIELAIGLQKYAIYPAGHPSLGRVSERVLGRLGGLLEERGSLSLGVARTQLVIEGIATDAAQPVLRQLALRFHEHHLAALRFDRGVEEAELRELLSALAVEATGGPGEPLGLRTPLPRWPHIRLSTLELGDLEIVERAAGEGSAAARLWLDLARAALAHDREEAAVEEVDPSPAVVARAIDRGSGSGTYDQVIAGYLIEITRSLQPGSVESADLVARVGQLVQELNPRTLRRLMGHGGDRRQQRAFLEAATDGLPVDTVVHLLTAAADAAGRPLSDALLRIYEKLTVHAARQDPAATLAAGADDELRRHVRALLEGWELPDPNPAPYERALAAIAGVRSGDGGADDVAEPDQRRVLQMCLEVDLAGPALDTAVDRMVADGQVAEVLDLIDATGSTRAAGAALARVARVENLPGLLADSRIDPADAAALVERMGEPGLTALLDGLLESVDTGVRRRTFDVLVALGPVIAPAVDGRLEGESRWFALRNLLALHEALGTTPAADLARHAAHEDGRVRREALKLLLRDPGRDDEVLLRILDDDDPRVVQLVRSAGAAAIPARGLALWRRRIADESLPEPLRASLVPLAAGLSSPEARDALLGLAARGRSLLGRPRLEPPTAVSLAALEALAEHWAHDDDAADLLARAARADDPALRKVAARARGSAPPGADG